MYERHRSEEKGRRTVKGRTLTQETLNDIISRK